MSLLRRLLLGNWPVKLAAVGLATVLYAGVALSENIRTWVGPVPIEVLRFPPGGSLLEQPGAVTEIRYRAPIEATSRIAGSSFRASIDLSMVEPRTGAEPVMVPVEVTSTDPRVRLVDWSPRSVNVRVDEVVTRGMPVTIETGAVPDGIEVGPLEVEPARVFLRGASSRVTNVRSAAGTVVIDRSGISIDQDVAIEARDEAGSPVLGVEIDPSSVRVRADVARRLGFVTLPVTPELVGEPGRGLRIASVRVLPATVTVGGEEAAARGLSFVETEEIDLDGIDDSREVDVGLRLPPGLSVVGDPRVTVTIEVAVEAGTRSLEVGTALTGTRADRTYRLEDPSLALVLGGTIDALDAVDASRLVGDVPVDGLDVGEHEVQPRVELPAGVDVVRVEPEHVRVTVGAVGDVADDRGERP